MAGSTEGHVGSVGRLSPAVPRRSTRLVMSMAEGRETDRQENQSPSGAVRRTIKRIRRVSSTETDLGSTFNVRNGTAGSESDRALLLRVLEELKELKDASNKQQEVMQQWQEHQTDHEQQLYETIHDLQQQLTDSKEELKQVKELLEASTRQRNDSPFPGSTQASYADVVRIPSGNRPRNVPNAVKSSPTLTESLFCTVDTSKVQAEEGTLFHPGEIRTIVEREVRNELDTPAWRCRAVTVGSKTANHIRVVCRNEDEHQMIKRVLEAHLPRGARVLRDEFYQIKVDGVSRTAVLDEVGKELPGINETFGSENATEVVKVNWLSDRFLKKHGSIVVYLKKAVDAARFLREGYFYAGGLSGQTSAFKHQPKPSQCYNCQELTDHKAYQCQKPRVCGRCAREGHHHSACTEVVTKCVPCGGPHESFSKSCRRLYPSRYE